MQKRAKRSGKQNAYQQYQDQDVVDFGSYKTRNNVEILPKNVRQEDYLLLLTDKNKNIVLATGPAGTGKTWMAVLAAIKALKAKECRKIVITRPAVSVDEEHGFLPGGLVEKLAPWTRPIFDVFEEYYSPVEIQNMIEMGIIEVSPLAYMRGRAEPLDNLIPTPSGYKRMGDLSVGEKVFGSDGSPITISGVFPQGEKDIYEITFDDGTQVECSGDHLWNTTTLSEKRHGKGFSTKTTLDILATLKTKNNQKNHEIPIVSQPVQYSHQDVTVDPYLMGSILGDGNITHGSIGFATADEEMIELLSERIDRRYSIKKRSQYDYRITRNEHVGYKDTIKYEFTSYGLWGKKSHEKFIPNEFKFNSVEVRIEVLRGLMDTDGSIFSHRSGKQRMQFYSVSPDLALDVKWIVESLGGVARMRTRIHAKDSGFGHNHPAHIVDFTMPKELNPFKLSRKADKFDSCRVKRLISDIKYVGKKECQCISVSAEDSLYLTGESNVVTHNTFKDSYIIADETQNTTREQMKMLLTRIGSGSKIVVTGDLAQHDRGYGENGLDHFIGLFKESHDSNSRIGIVEFDRKHVERHPVVSVVLGLYGEK